MPYIQSRLSVPVTAEKAEKLKSRLGQSISIFPGKSESRLMVDIQGDCCIYFKGDQEEPSAMVKVELFGAPNEDACNEFTGALCNILKEELGISGDRVFVNYQGFSIWGFDGANF